MRRRLLFAVAVGLLPAACGSSRETDTAASAPARERAVVPLSVEPRLPVDARTFRVRRHRLRVKLPADWRLAGVQATDRLSLVDRVVLAAGTSAIRPRVGAACSGRPDEPRVEVGPTEALVVVEEDVRARADLARRRPRFRLLEQVAAPDASRRGRAGVFPSWSCRNEVGISGLRETSYADGGRVFSVTVVVGKTATETTRSEALGVVKSVTPLRD